MTNIVQNLRGSRRLRVAAPLLPAAVLPILLTGVTVPAATGIGAAFESVERVEERARRVDVAARRIAEFGDLAQIDELRRAIEVLRNIVPEADEIPAEPRVTFDSSAISIYADSWRVGLEG